MKILLHKKRYLWAIGSLTALSAGFWLCRYPLFHLHGMQEWPRNLWLLGAAVIACALFFDARKVMILTPVGYLIGFAVGALLGRDGLDPGGGATSSGWAIWTACFVTLVLAGAVWEWIARHKAK